MSDDVDSETIALREHAVGERSSAAADRAPVSAVGQVPLCEVHRDVPSSIRCRECGAPTCARCREESVVGLLCAGCAEHERATDGVSVTPRLAKAAVAATVLVAVVGAATALSPALVRELAFAPFTLTSSPWRLATGLLTIPRLGFGGLALVLLPFWLTASASEHRRGAASTIVTALLGGLAGFVMLYVVSIPTQPAWSEATGTVAAATVALAVSAGWPDDRTGRWRTWSTLAVAGAGTAAVLLLGMVPLWQLLGGLVMGCIVQLVHHLVPRPQRHPLPLFIALGVGVFVLVLTLVIGLFVRT